MGFMQGMASSCVFYHAKRKLRTVIHGDDFTTLGYDADLDWYREQVKKRLEIKEKGRMGPAKGDVKTMRVLNRILEWRDNEVRYEPDQRHAEIICQEMGLGKTSKTVVTPGIKEILGEEKELGTEEARKFRALAARANYLAQDRIDIQYATKELCRDMAKPTE